MVLADYLGKYWAGAEVMYGIIIAMTFTSSLRGLASPVLADIVLHRTIAIALACCVAWGITDGLFYVWERGYIQRQERRIIRMSRSSENRQSAIPLIGEQLDDTVLRNLPPANRQRLYENLAGYLSSVDARDTFSLRDSLFIIFGTLVRSALAGFIVTIPLFLIPDLSSALLLSNLCGILLLFGVGYNRAPGEERFTRVLFGLGTSFVGIAIAGLTILLGG